MPRLSSVTVQSRYFIAKDADAWQVAVKLAKIQAVADQEPVRDFKSSESNRDFNDAEETGVSCKYRRNTGNSPFRN